MPLHEYTKKRKFTATLEPTGSKKKQHMALRFVIQKHQASHLHYDLRLEINGVLKSWAVPKGPSLNPDDKRLAIMVEDHPYEYKDFEGSIPAGNYGAGNVIIWDEGTFTAREVHQEDLNKFFSQQLKQGHINFILDGKKLHGEFSLIKLKNMTKNSWLLMKKNDQYSSKKNILEKDKSVRSGKAIAIVNKKMEKLSKLPLPKNIKPMLANLVKKAFNREGWLFEIKWDGFRILAYLQHNQVKLMSRKQKDYTSIFHAVADDLSELNINAILDGEMVVLDTSGHANFQSLQQFQKTAKGQLVYYVFDLIWLNGKDLCQLPLVQRKTLLHENLPSLKHVRFNDHIENFGKDFFQLAAEQHLEGIMAKDAMSSYQAGVRSQDWLKIKIVQQQEVVIGGYTAPRGSRHQLGALMLGVYENKELIYVGHTGSGFNEVSLTDLKQRLDPLKQINCPFADTPRANARVTWVKPILVCEVTFSEWTEAGHLRQAIFRGLREDKSARAVRREQIIKPPSPKPSINRELTLSINRHAVKVSHLNKAYWPHEGYTKKDLIGYYREMAPIILPHLKDRPESLNRHPNGITGTSFFQKNVPNAPNWVKTKMIYSMHEKHEIQYILCQNEATLIYMANLGCIELNPWLSRVRCLEKPDFCVLDLDPEDIEFAAVVKTALAIHRLLDTIGADHHCKTSGATGLHIYIPMRAKYSYEQSKDFAQLIAAVIHDQLPDITSIERMPNKRQGRVYIDYLQNRHGQTIAAPYALRPRPGAPVSTPLAWRELTRRLNPLKFTINTIHRRVDTLGDLWQDILKTGVNLKKCMLELQKLLE